jgi:PAS domain S-box-containing protein
LDLIKNLALTINYNTWTNEYSPAAKTKKSFAKGHMHNYRLSELLDMSLIQRLADSNFKATSLPMSIIDMYDTSILVRAGWTDICMKFHRAYPASLKRCHESDAATKGNLVEGQAYWYKCKNGLWHVAIPIVVAGAHLATMFLTQFVFEGEVPEREYFVRQGQGFNYDLKAYLDALDKLPVFSIEKINHIIDYDKAMVRFISDLAEQSLKVIETKKSLAESEEKFRTLINNINIAVCRTSPSGRYLQANPAMAKMLGYDTTELLMQAPVSDLYRNVEDRKRFFEKLQVKGAVKDVELMMQKKDKTPIWVSVSVTAQYDEKHAIKWVDSVLEDITERKQAQDAIFKLNEELEQKVVARTRELSEANIKLKELDRLKSMFLANMSHEIRTPMNGIIGMADLLMDTRLDREQQEFVKAVKSSADALLTVINDILDFSKIEAQKLELETIGFNLRDSIGDTLHTLSFRASAKGLELACDVLHNIPDAVIGDPGRLRQIIINLVGNSIKFTEKGEVVLSVEPEWIREGETLLHFVVSDTGIGIPLEKQGRVFEAFSQVDASTTRQYGGTGLGLTISARLVELMGGRIWVKSQPGQGSQFHFTVQLGLQKEGAVRQIPERLENLQDLPVLVVDDNATNRRILEEMLNHWHMAPTGAGNGAMALELLFTRRLQARPYRLLLIDVHMPGMDGFELVRRIRQDPDNSDLVIMILTSSGQRGDAARCRELKISAYLTKPVKQSSLLDAIMTVLGKIEPQDSLPQLVTQHVLREKQKLRLRILLAEDNVVNQKIASSILTKRGHTVVVAGNGKEVLADLKAPGGEKFDLILMDVQMPEMDGLETTAHIREKEKMTGAHIPIIALTAHAMRGDRETCLNAGMDGYATKPLKIDELFKAIESVFPIS